MLQINWKEEEALLDQVAYYVPGRRIKAHQQARPLELQFLNIYHAEVEGLPEGLQALICCSDLQGHIKEGSEYILLGEWLPDYLLLLLESQFPTIDPQLVGIGLSGDLFAMTQKRGGGGDVRPVWNAFNEHFRWVAGVAGNHDRFGTKEEQQEFERQEGIHLLAHHIIELDGLLLAGISGIIGNPEKPFRVDETSYLTALKRLLLKRPDLLFLHESPSATGQKGNPQIRAILEQGRPCCLFSGHCQWSKVQEIYSNDLEVYNIDARVVILTGK